MELNMNLLHLRYFAKLAQTLHYTRAAEHLCIAQPSLSHAISQMEAELGVPLFEKVNLNEGTMIETMDVKVNGTKICTIEYYFDTENSEVYMRIPELNEGYIKMNMEQMTQEAEAEMEEEGLVCYHQSLLRSSGLHRTCQQQVSVSDSVLLQR